MSIAHASARVRECTRKTDLSKRTVRGIEGRGYHSDGSRSCETNARDGEMYRRL